MAVTLSDQAVAGVEDALTTIVRHATLPRARQRLLDEAGMPFDAAAYPVVRGIGAKEPVRLTELAADLGLEISTVSRHIKQLERAGLVQRTGDPTDGRASVLALTAGGKRALRRLQETRRRLVERLLDGWTDAEKATMARLLGRMADAFVGQLPQ